MEGGRVEGRRVNNGTSKEGTERGMDGAREIKEGGSEQTKEGAGREGATERGRGVREQGRQGNFKGGTLRRTLLKILVLQMKNSELVYINSVVMRCNVLFDRWMT